MAIQQNSADRFYAKIHTLVFDNKIKEALTELGSFMLSINANAFMQALEQMNETYKLVLDYYIKGVQDPERDNIIKKIKISILELSDTIYQHALSQTGMYVYYLKNNIEKEKDIAKEQAAKEIDSYTFEQEFTRLLEETDLSIADVATDNVLKISPKLFELMWLTDKYTETDTRLVSAIRKSKNLAWQEKCITVSAVTLSLINSFDKEKLIVLADFYEDREHQVWQRALTGLIIAAVLYDKRLALYPEIQNRFKVYAGNETFISDLDKLLVQMLKSQETEKLTRKFHEEIVPNVKKFESKIREKLDIDNIIKEDLLDDKNPGWEEVFEDNPDLLDKMQEISEMQMEGLDLFMSTFSMLKHFNFFNEISNWFRPFYKEQPDVEQVFSKIPHETSDFLAGLEKSFYICNSDKYSFALNIGNMPDEQSAQIISLFTMESQAMQEAQHDDEMVNKVDNDRYVFTQYVQDLYRFFKLYTYRSDFKDIFTLRWNIARSWLLSTLENNETIIRSSAEFLFKKERYYDAGYLFSKLLKHNDSDVYIFEKLAYCYQKVGNFHKAVEYYKKAEIFDKNRIWSLKKIIYCYRKLGDAEQAIQWSLEAEKLLPQDSYIQIMLGNSYLDLQNYGQALAHYLKADFMSENNNKVLRPIIWCCFMLDKYDLASSYFRQLEEKQIASAHDYVIAGYTAICLQQKAKAAACFSKALSFADYTLKDFTETIENEKKYLFEKGILPNDLQLIVDFVG